MRSVIDRHFTSEMTFAEIRKLDPKMCNHGIGRQAVELLKSDALCKERRGTGQLTI